MICRFTLTAGESVEHMTADPTTPEGRASVLAAFRRVQAAHPGHRVEVEGRAAGPVHISEPLSAILREAEASLANQGREAAQ